MLFKCRPSPPCPSCPRPRPRAGAPIFLSNTRNWLNPRVLQPPASSTPALLSPSKAGFQTQPKALSPPPAQTPKGCSHGTTDVRKAKASPAELPHAAARLAAPQLPPLLPAKACPARDARAPLRSRQGSAAGRGRKSRRRQLPSRVSAAARWAPILRSLLAPGPVVPGRGRRSNPEPDWRRGEGVVQERRPRNRGQQLPGSHPAAPGPHPRHQSPPRRHRSLPKTLLPGRKRRPWGRGPPGSEPCQVVTGGDR